MRANLSADSKGKVMGERADTNVQRRNTLEGCSMKDQLSALERQHPDKQDKNSSFAMKRYLGDAINPFNALAPRQECSPAPGSRTTMEAYTRAWDLQFQEATRRNGGAERSL